MDVREKLVELLTDFYGCDPMYYDVVAFAIAQYLIDRGVTVQELDGCYRCKDTSEMTISISNKLIAGVRTGWLGGNLPAKFCPFCGRSLPQPPKGE